jgi:hypothetical protein
MKCAEYNRTHNLPHMSTHLIHSGPPMVLGRNERKRVKKLIRAEHTRREWVELHRGAIRERHRENGLNKYGTKIGTEADRPK